MEPREAYGPGRRQRWQRFPEEMGPSRPGAEGKEARGIADVRAARKVVQGKPEDSRL